MKRKLIRNSVVIILVFILILSIGVFLKYRSVIHKPLKSNNETITIKVDEGEGVNSLLNKLQSEGILKSKLFTKLVIKLGSEDTNIIPGEYEVNSNVSLKELLDNLRTEDLTKNQISVTIPEGYNIDEMAKLFEEKGMFSKDEFINAIKSYELPIYVKDSSEKKYNIEGFLYPDTYYFPKDAKPEDVIRIMNSSFDKVIKEISAETGVDINDNNLEMIINIASLIEEEAQRDDERKLVSSVIYNRLEQNMKLQFCSTINYAWGEHIENLRNRHLEIDSPFNTYKNIGLSVGPIASPGKESIIAAVQPEETDYLYFVLLKDGDGKHHFSSSASEHEKVKREQGL